MLDHIEDEDPAIRDELIYSTWCRLLEDERLSSDQKRFVLKKLLDEKYLLTGINQGRSNSVLTRSFTSLLLTVLLAESSETKWMNMENQKEIVNQAFSWLEKELDYRGYDDDLGWIHAFAHGADLLVEIVKLDICGFLEVTRIMSILKQIITTNNIFLWGEEDRLNLVIIQLLKLNKLNEVDLNEWCTSVGKSLTSWEANKKWSTFLQSLYFKMNFEKLQLGGVEDYINSYLLSLYRENRGTL